MTHLRVFNRKPPRIPFTRQGYEKAIAEKAALDKDRPDAVENLRKAREMGDLSENGYYKAARARLSFIDARLRRINHLIRSASIIEPRDDGTIDIGSTVTVSVGGAEVTYTIVGGYESDPGKHTISHMSPLGRMLVGRRTGDSVTVTAPAGEMTYEILSVV